MDKQLLEQEAEKLYPPTFETLGIRYDNPVHLVLQKAYIAGATSSSTVKEWFDAGLATNKIMLDDFTEQIENITKCLPKDFHPDISLPARIMNLWQYYQANENKVKSLQEAVELTLAKDMELCEINDTLSSTVKELEREVERLKQLIEDIFYDYGIGYIGKGRTIEQFKQKHNL